MGAILLGIAAIIAALGTVAVQLSGIAETRRSRRVLEAQGAAQARTTAQIAVGVASVGAKVDAGVRKVDANTELTESIHHEVASANGITGVELAERAEGRRIQEIPVEQRTPDEQGYVDRLIAGGRNM